VSEQSIIERVAKAIYEEDDPWHKAWPWPNLNESQGSPEPYRRIAAAAIKAMREPTSPMIAAAWDLLDAEKKRMGIARLGPGVGAADIYRAMIDAALVGEG